MSRLKTAALTSLVLVPAFTFFTLLATGTIYYLGIESAKDYFGPALLLAVLAGILLPVVNPKLGRQLIEFISQYPVF